MAEGDTIHRNARRLAQALGNDPITRAEAPSRQSPLARQPAKLRGLVGKRLLAADAHGKHLFLRFEGDMTLHCHQGMRGSWHVYEPGERWRKPRAAAWIALTTDGTEAVEFGGSRMALRSDRELRRDPSLRALGPDLLASEFEIADGVLALRQRASQSTELGEALLDQTVIAGIGNIFKSEGCFAAGLDPWRRLESLDDDELERVVHATTALMRTAVRESRMERLVYHRAGEPCLKCRGRISSRGQGDSNRTTYWCPACQV